MSKDYRAEVEATLARTRESIRSRAERIANCEVESTDCALSMMADRETVALCEKQLELLDGNCEAWFSGYATLDGEVVDARWVDTRYGSKLVVDMPNGETVWTTADTEKGLAKRNLKKVMIKRTAWAKLVSNGNSFASGRSIVVYPAYLNRTTGEYNEDIEVLEVAQYDYGC